MLALLDPWPAHTDKGGNTHILRCNRYPRREEENHGHERVPGNRYGIDPDAVLAHMPGPLLHAPIDHLANDGYDIGHVQCNRTDIEDGADGSTACQTEEVDDDFENSIHPDGDEWSL